MENKHSLLQHTMSYGSIAGALLIFISLGLYLLDFMPSNLMHIMLISLVSYAVIIIMVVVGTKSYRDKILGGKISYDKAVIAGLLIIVFCSILNNFYTMVFNLWIDPGYMEKVYSAMKDWTFNMLANAGVPDDQIDQTMQNIEQQQANYTPLRSFFSGVSLSLLFGGILSAITSAFIYKKSDPFEPSN